MTNTQKIRKWCVWAVVLMAAGYCLLVFFLPPAVEARPEMDFAGLPELARDRLLSGLLPVEPPLTTVDNWQQKWPDACRRLVAKAQSRHLDAAALEKCLAVIRTECESDGKIGVLPIRAILAREGKEPVWIIVCAWGYPPLENGGHVRVYAFAAGDQRRIGFASCM